MGTNAKRASRIFNIAAWYGFIVLFPLLFLEKKIGQDMPPEITHPEFFYGFIGVALAWQVLFLILAKDPVRYRVFMIPAMLEKLSYGIAGITLFLLGRLSLQGLAGGAIDLIFVALFAYAYRTTK